jgi:nitrite reductase (cytochrome c-552)
MLVLAEDALARTHIEAKFAWEKGATEAEMKPILRYIRHAQWRWDWVSSANGMGFHSPNVALRTLGTSIQKSQEAHAEIVRLLAKKGFTDRIPLPDISTKEKAQRYIGLDMKNIVAKKKEFLAKVPAEWDEAARVRQGTLEKY